MKWSVQRSRLKLNSFYMEVPVYFTRLDELGVNFDSVD